MMPVPYPPNREGGRTNAGFLDLRGQPTTVDDLPEAESSQALHQLLRVVASQTLFMTIGCDLGAHREKRRNLKNPEVAGGYLQYASGDYANVGADWYFSHAQAIECRVRRASRGYSWKMFLALKWCRFNLDEQVVDAPSVMVWFGPTHLRRMRPKHHERLSYQRLPKR